MLILGGSWCFFVVFGVFCDSLWFLVIFVGSWYFFFMVFGGSWLFLVVLGNKFSFLLFFLVFLMNIVFFLVFFVNFWQFFLVNLRPSCSWWTFGNLCWFLVGSWYQSKRAAGVLFIPFFSLKIWPKFRMYEKGNI